jgi:hypothetical protein
MRGSSKPKASTNLFDRLADDIKASKLSRAEVEGILYRLSPNQRRLFLRLASGGKFDTNSLRNELAIGNISQCAKSLSAKLAQCNDSRRVLCETSRNLNEFNDRVMVGHWSLIDLDVCKRGGDQEGNRHDAAA